MTHKWEYLNGKCKLREWDGRSDVLYQMWSSCKGIGAGIYPSRTYARSGIPIPSFRALVLCALWRGSGPSRRTTSAAVKDAERLAEECLVDLRAALGLMTGRLKLPEDVYDE